MSEYLQSVCIPVSCLPVSVSVSVCQSSQSLLYPIHPTSPPPQPLPSTATPAFPHHPHFRGISAPGVAWLRLSQSASRRKSHSAYAGCRVRVGSARRTPERVSSAYQLTSPHLTHLTSSTPPPLPPLTPPPTPSPSPLPTPRNGPEQNHCDRRRPGPGALLLLRASPGL